MKITKWMVCALAAPVMGVTAGCAGGANTELAGEPGSKIVCERIAVTGSHRKERVCMRAEEWQTAAEETRAQTQEEMRRAREHYNDVNTPVIGGVGN